MSEEIITFPTRMKVKMRGISISEMRSMLQSFRVSIIGSHTDVLKTATVELVDVGDYPEEHIVGKDGTVDWLKATSEDRIWGIMSMRRISYPSGDSYKMAVNCNRCDKEFVRDVDLRSIEDGGDILVWEFENEEHRSAFKNGIPFEGRLGDKTIKWRMLYGEDEALIEKISTSNPNAATDELGMNARIVEVEGMHRNDVPAWVKTISSEWFDLTDMMAEATAGVDLMVEGRCPFCNAVDDYSVPFDLEFWIPAVQKTKDRRSRRRTAILTKKGREL